MGGLAAAAVGPGNDLQQVTVRVFEVQSAAAVPVVDHPKPGLAGICPVREALATDMVKGRIEVLLTHEERVMLGRYRPCGLGEVERDALVSPELRKEQGHERQGRDRGPRGRVLCVHSRGLGATADVGTGDALIAVAF